MTLFQYINANFDRVKYDIKIGLISPATLRHFQIYSRYDYYRMQGFNFRDSVLSVSIDLNVCESRVPKIIKKMEEDV